MKKFLLVCTVVLFSFQTYSQITLSTADFPHSGDIDTVSTATAFSGMDYLTTGANQVWDFERLDSTTTGQRIDTFLSVSTTGQIFSLYFGILNPANQALRKPDVTIGPVSITGVYDFFNNSSANYRQAGFGGSPSGLPITLPIASIPVAYKPMDIIYKFPLQFGNVDSSTAIDTLGFSGLFYYKNLKKRLNEVDGWGSVTTPYGTFECLRLKSTIHEHDTVYLDTLGQGLAFDLPERIEYKWLGRSLGQPILIVVTTAGIVSEITYYGYPVCNVAAFSTTQDTIVEGTTLNFTNNTVRTNTYQWKIDGTPYSTAKDISYTFNTPGIYTVTVIATHLNCVDSVSKVITVLHATCAIAASFNTPIDTIFDGTTLTFTNTSGPASSFTNYVWESDSGILSTNKDLSYTFTTPGIYTITMVVTDVNCVDSTSRVITVFYSNCNLATVFSSSDETIFTGQTVTFSGSSTAPVSYVWDINGVSFSNAKDTALTFNTSGTYIVTLISNHLNCTEAVSKTIKVLPPLFDLDIYPVPVTDKVTIYCVLPENSDMRIEMIDLLGQTLVTNEWNNLEAGEHHLFLSIPPSAMASSVYFLKIKWKYGEFVRNIAVMR